jgi:hypothetical protein
MQIAQTGHQRRATGRPRDLEPDNPCTDGIPQDVDNCSLFAFFSPCILDAVEREAAEGNRFNSETVSMLRCSFLFHTGESAPVFCMERKFTNIHVAHLHQRPPFTS